MSPDHGQADVSMWPEALVGIEMLLLHATPAYYGLGVPHGDNSAVVLIPGFLGTDLYLTEMYGRLRRIGYSSYFSGVGLNADCPNLLIQRHLKETVDRALDERGRRINLIGHSLGGIIARSLAAQRAADVASVITMGSPFRGTVIHSRVLKVAEIVRTRILNKHGGGVGPGLLHTGHCTCRFLIC